MVRPWCDIQATCQPNMSTAKIRIKAVKTSWPVPWKAFDKAAANTATRLAPAIPAAIPPAIQRARPTTLVVAARMTPTMMPGRLGPACIAVIASVVSRSGVVNDQSM